MNQPSISAKVLTLTLLLSVLLLPALHAQNTRPNAAPTSIALVVDKEAADALTRELAGYSQVLQSRGLRPILLVDRWQQPDSIRAELKKLHQTQQLEGAVFIGNIPVPMLRDAQHLTSAFKMDQNRDWQASSIPSDRFYDDFDLAFDYIKQDSLQSLYHYYSLRSDSPQRLHCDIYSARIKPPQVPGKTRLQALADYFNKIVAQAQPPALNQLLYFAGHGYNSNDMIARIDEKTALREQFPALARQKNAIHYLDFTFEDFIKERLRAALQEPDLGLAILHHHGSDDAQLLSGTPQTSDARRWIANTQKFFRGKIRSAKDTTASKQYYIDQYQVPASWVEGAFDPQIMLADSLIDAAFDITIPDLHGYTSQAKALILDACFTGSFHLDDYLSAYYIFNPGQTMVVKACSVNSLQDIWPDQLMELLGMGARFGLWAKGHLYLESHLIGDPTFAFAPLAGAPLPVAELNRALALETGNPLYWEALLRAGSGQQPELRALALKRLQEMGAISTRELLSWQKQDPSSIVRLQAFTQIAAAADATLPEAIIAGIQDNYELLRRLAMLYAAKNGAPQLLPYLAQAKVSPYTSTRVAFQLGTAVTQFPAQDYLQAIHSLIPAQSSLWMSPQALAGLERSLLRRDSVDKAEMAQLFLAETRLRSKQFTISALRNSCNVLYLNDLFRFLKESDDLALRRQLVEAFGWYRYSYYKEDIIKVCHEVLARTTAPELVYELQKTLARLQ